MDYLPIQASSVPCERIFSSSAETDTKRRNRISPLLMEALQMLKAFIKTDSLNFMSSWKIEEKDLSTDEPEADLLGELEKSRGDKKNPQCFADLHEVILKLISSYDE